MTRARQLTRLSVLAVLGCAAVYVVAFGTSWGLDLDRYAVPEDASGVAWERAHAAFWRVLDTIHVPTVALAACGAILVALRRGRRDLIPVALLTLGGANVTTFVLKPLLARADPLGGEALRAIDVAFPSGHATVAMSFALVAVIVAPRRWRGWAAAAGAAYAAAVGVGTVLTTWHYPSDVVGGFLVATAWAAASAAIFLARREAPAPKSDRRPYAVSAAVAVAGTLMLLIPARELAHGVFAATAVAIAAIALLLPVGLTLVLARRL
jgi:membrane-associated phospholipid phosphatase